jgi:prepilin-type N-terminal cleavage/methylation domain-containing protein
MSLSLSVRNQAGCYSEGRLVSLAPLLRPGRFEMFRSARLIDTARARYSKPAQAVFSTPPSRRAQGFSLLELIIVMAISISIVAFAAPTFLSAFYTIRLKSAASNLSGLMQQARIQAARRNAIITVKYRVNGNVQQAYIDFNNNDQWDAPEPIISFSGSIRMAGGPPGGAGAPPLYVLVGDTAGVTFDNTSTLGYSQRGLPCAYAGGLCATPAPGYFVYYIQDLRPGNVGWGGVVVTRSGRTKPIIWNGASWQ